MHSLKMGTDWAGDHASAVCVYVRGEGGHRKAAENPRLPKGPRCSMGGTSPAAEYPRLSRGPRHFMGGEGSQDVTIAETTVADQRLNERGMGLKEWMDDDGSMGHGPWTLVWSVRPLKLRGSTITGDRVL